jgi:flagellar basal-body rod protein FlgG
MQRIDVVSNNLANVNTTAFKRDAVAAQSFSNQLAHRIDDPAVQGVMRLFGNQRAVGLMNSGVFIDEVFTNFESGGIRHTAGPLDVALTGPGFFVINVINADGSTQEKLSRDGAFTLAADGTLITLNGSRVQGADGDIVIPNGAITIDANGRIYSNGEYVDTLRTLNVGNTESLRKTRGSYWTTTPETEFIAFTGRMEQGFLENSNVSAVREMVELIALHRAYEANSRMVQIHDETLGRAVNEIARR